MKRVKKLAGNEIELGMKIPTIESRESNIPMTKGITYVVITVRPIKIFVEYVGTKSRFRCWLLRERCLGHFYIVLEPVGSASLTFGDDRYYEFMCFDVPKVVRSPG